MLVDEISVGEQVSIALASSGSVPDDLAVGDEVAFRPEGMGFILHTADRSFEVEGRSPEDARTLRRLTGNQIDLIAWIRSTPRQLGKDKRSALFISAIPFPPPKRTGEAFVLEVGDVHEAEIRRFVPRGSSGRGSKGNSGATAEVEWLKNDLLLPPAMADQLEIDDADSTAPEERSDPAVSRHRMIVSAGHGGALRDAFRIHGRTLSVDVRCGDSGAWEVHRLVRSRSESGALFVLHAPIEISDRTTATVIREEYRSELLGGLDLDGTEAFLKLWDGYQQIEHKSIEERAARLGSVPYLSRRRTPAGDWRFLLKAPARPFFEELGTDALTASAEDPARGGGDQSFGRSSFISRVQRTLDDPPRVDLADPGSANEPPERGFLAPSGVSRSWSGG